MSTTLTTPPPTIVITEDRRRRRGLIWLAAGAAAAIALSGTTLALWGADGGFSGGTITAGDLNLEPLAQQFYDVSGDRADGEPIPGTGSGTAGALLGHTIDPATWRMVPGDRVAAVFPATVTLSGDNLVAKLSMTGTPITGAATENPHLTWSYAVFQDDVELVAESALAADDTTLFHLSATGMGQGGGDDHTADTAAVPVLPLDRDNTGAVTSTFTVVVFATFDENAGDGDSRSGADTAEALTDIHLKLSQVRDTGAQFASGPTPNGSGAPGRAALRVGR